MPRIMVRLVSGVVALIIPPFAFRIIGVNTVMIRLKPRLAMNKTRYTGSSCVKEDVRMNA